MDIKKLQSIVVDALEDIKAQDIVVFDTVHLTSLFDRVVIASGTSNRQTKALAASVRDKVKSNGGEIVSMEGETTGEWVLVDLGGIVVHIMQPAIRAYYRLEELWGDKPVKLGAAKRSASKSAAPVEVTHTMMAIQAKVDDDAKPARKPRVRKTAETEGEVAKPARAPRTRKTSTIDPAIPSGGRVKVAASKTAVASAKEAAAIRTERTARATRAKTAAAPAAPKAPRARKSAE